MSMIRLVLACVLVVGICISCDSPVEGPQYGDLVPSSTDSAAIAWNPLFVLSGGDSLISAPPAADEGISAVKEAIANRTEAQNKAIRTWNTGTYLRWNELTRNIVARYNVAPLAERTPNGTFTGRFLPDPNKPFASPPFTARLYALVNAGQYDALIWAWRLKYQHRRPAPSTVDPTIVTAGPSSGTPSYPNEDAVVSRVTVEIVSFFYPGERAYLEAQLQECTSSRVAAGLARPSDIAGGDSLGRRVAALLIDRAKNDGFSKADDQARWKAVDAAMVTTWPKWRSTETPTRPPMLPFFGEVKPWNITDAASFDPGPPPSEGTAVYDTDMDEMRSISVDRTREQIRIANYWSDGEGTFTPPIHWHLFASERLREARFSMIRMARVMAYTSTSLHDAAVVCWYTKYKYNTARPITIDNVVRMPIGLPNFPGYSSGHSTFSGAAATVLGHFFPSYSQGYMMMAREAGDSRVYGCIHVRIDCTVGLKQGQDIGAVAVARAVQDGAE